MAGTIRSVAQGNSCAARLNGVRPRWPEQSQGDSHMASKARVSMESGLDGRNNLAQEMDGMTVTVQSQWSPA